jgi:hypothetical protein
LRSKALVIPSIEAPMRTAFVKCMVAMVGRRIFRMDRV